MCICTSIAGILRRCSKSIASNTMSAAVLWFYAIVAATCMATANSKVAYSVTTVAYTGSTTTIACPMPGAYTLPRWSGPLNTMHSMIYTIQGSVQFNPNLGEKFNRLSFAQDQKSLVLVDTRISDSGTYTCEVVVQSLGTNNLVVRNKPMAPEITSSAALYGSGIRAVEGQTVTVTCTSRGGYPVPTVTWYKGNTTGQLLAQTSTGTQVGDTFTVTLAYTFTPTRQDHGQQLVCRSYWPTPADAQGTLETNVTINISLKPTRPAVSQANTAASGSVVYVKCQTTGSRPAANISWVYQGRQFTSTVIVVKDPATDTFTAVSVFRKTVAAVDNGQVVQCVVEHATTATVLKASYVLNVTYPVVPYSTTITGNREILAGGPDALNLTCTTGSSNPPSVITWKSGNNVITNTNPYTVMSGSNNGTVRSQTLVIHPTSSDDGRNISCLVSNGISQFVDTATIQLLVVVTNITTISYTGTTTTLDCPAPHASFILPSWQGPPYFSTAGTVYTLEGQEYFNPVLGAARLARIAYAANKRSLVLRDTSLEDAGVYSCLKIGSDRVVHEYSNTLQVRAKPSAPIITASVPVDNYGIRATEDKTVTVTCMSVGGFPAPTVAWYKGGVSGQLLEQTNVGTSVGSNYTVELSHTFTPTRQDDRRLVTCRSFYPLPANKQASEEKSLALYLYLKPGLPSVQQTGHAVSGGTATLTCKTDGSRPAASIVWQYHGVTYAPGVTVGTQASSETFTTTSVLRLNVTDADDGETAQCVVTHPAIAGALVGNVTVNVEPRPSSITTIGYTGTTTTLDCPTPHASFVLPSWRGPPYLSSAGTVYTLDGNGYFNPGLGAARLARIAYADNNRSLVLRNTSLEDAGVYRCLKIGKDGVVHEYINTFHVRALPVALNLTASVPLTNGTLHVTVGKAVTVTCTSFGGYPTPTVALYRGSTACLPLVQISTGTQVGNGFTVALPYTFAPSRQDDGQQLTCRSFWPGPADTQGALQTSVTLLVHGPPSPPEHLHAYSVDHQSLNVSWRSMSPVDNTTDHVIQYSTDGATWRYMVVAGGAGSNQTQSVLIDALAGNKTFNIRVMTKSEHGESAWSDIVKATTAALTCAG